MRDIHKEYTIFCDESEKHGKYYSNFYGGVLVGSQNYLEVVNALNNFKKDANILSEAKWSKTSEYTLKSYKNLISVFFKLHSEGKIKSRIMFRKNDHTPTHLTSENKRDDYFILYYHFLNRSFGFEHMPKHQPPATLRVYLDKLPIQTKERVRKFKSILLSISNKNENLLIKPENITEVDSKNHILLQCIDIVLGSIVFHLNDKHLYKTNDFQQGKRTIAKENLYRHILEEIKKTTGKHSFNIKKSSSLTNFPSGRWNDPYLHWSFTPK